MSPLTDLAYLSPQRCAIRNATILAGLAFLAAAACPGSAGADRYAVGNIHMRVGPGTAHPVIATVQTGTAVTVHGCTRGWCDATWGGRRGWVYGPYLRQAPLQRRVRGDRRRSSRGQALIRDTGPSRSRALVRDRDLSRGQTLFGHDQTLFGQDGSLFRNRF
jgi:uncharacterized protein YraI